MKMTISDADLTDAIDRALDQVGPGGPDDTAMFVRQASAVLFAGQQ
jgi:hypothetical protein